MLLEEEIQGNGRELLSGTQPGVCKGSSAEPKSKAYGINDIITLQAEDFFGPTYAPWKVLIVFY